MKNPFKSLSEFIKKSKKTLLLIIIASLVTLLISTIISIWLSRSNNLSFPSFGTIYVTGVEVYGGDINKTQDGTLFLDWGTVYPGTTVNRSLYINNTKSNVPVILELKISNITFLNSKDENVTKDVPYEAPMNLTWNYNNTILNLKEAIYVTLTLKVSSDSTFLEYLINSEVVKFNFDIIIEALPGK